jgi:hypothetical protein
MKSPRLLFFSFASKLGWKFLVGAFLFLFAALACFVQPGMAQAPTKVVLKDHVPKPVLDGRATLVGPFKLDQMLRLVVGLKHPHMAEEEQFLHDLQADKHSPMFHHFLTADEWNARFAPSAQDEQAVVDWAESNGLKVSHRYANRLLVDLEGNAATIQKALNVAINAYTFETESRYSNDRDPQIPANLANIIQSVGGLNNIAVLHPKHMDGKHIVYPIYVPGEVAGLGPSGGRDGARSTPPSSTKGSRQSQGPAVAATPNITNGNYDPADIWSSQAYDTNALNAQGHCCNPLHGTDAPPEASIAIATAGTQNQSDFLNFPPFSLAEHFVFHNIDGTGTCCDLEGTMDFEWSTAMANSFGSFHDTATVHMYDGVNANLSTFTDIFNQMLSDGSARVMSTSWGCAEGDCYDNGTMDTQDGIFASMVAQGWTLMAASDDTGAVSKDGSGNCVTHDAVEFPASSPHVVAVGGTTLSLDSFGNYLGETGWTGGTTAGSCNSNNGGSGGGCSVHFGIPSYQGSSNNCPVFFFGILIGHNRAVPDVALNASALQNIFFNGSLQGNGGTSIASPEMAGFFAQSNAYLLSLGNICGSGSSPCAPQGDPHANLYETTGARVQTAPHNPYYDITTGCNSNDVTAANNLNFFCAGAGYDQVTGWGSINMLQMAWALNWAIVPGFSFPVISFSGPATGVWYNTDQEISWTVTAPPGNGFPSDGVAGFTQGWDSISSDPSGEATPGSGNSFYSGPQFPNATTGCLSLAGGFGCAGGVSQGFHTVHVQAWDNEGESSGDHTIGPFGYDTIPPFTLFGQSPGRNFFGWNNSTVQVTLSPTDPGAPATGSGIFATYYTVDNPFCGTVLLGNCVVYGGPFSITTQGAHTVYFFSRDVAGNFEGINSVGVNIDETAPVTGASLSGTLNGAVYVSPVNLTLSATDNLSGVASTLYQINGGVLQTYAGPFGVSSLGGNIVTFHSTDKAGNVEATKSVSFTIKGATSTTVASSKNPSILGSAVTFTATVSATVGTATGLVTFKDGATTLGTGTLIAGKATFTTSGLSLGSHSITAIYAGGTNFFGSTSAALTQHVLAATSTSVAASVNPSVFGQTVIFTATVTSATPGTITGTVTFKNGAIVLGSGVVSGGKATFSTSALIIGIHSITGIYSGDATYATSTSPALSHTVNKAASKTTMTSSVDPSVFGQAVQFTATVTAVAPGAGTPTGTVTFKNGLVVVGSGTLVSGKATFSTSALTVGAHSITATYNGGIDFNTSLSSPVTQTVNKAATKTTLTSSANPSILGHAVTFTATVVAVAPGSGAPTGSVTLKDGATVLGTGTLISGKATFTTSLLAHGSHSMTAVYLGSANDVGSTSAVLTQTVN